MDIAVKVSRQHTINIFLVGKTGAGNTTILNRLLNTHEFVEDWNAMSVTKEVQYAEFKLEHNAETFNCKVIDSRGIRDRNSSDELSISQIKDAMTTITASPHTVNLVLFVVRDVQDLQFISTIKQSFTSRLSEVAALVITHCEDKNDHKRQQFVENLKSTTKDIDYMKKGIYTVGFPDLRE